MVQISCHVEGVLAGVAQEDGAGLGVLALLGDGRVRVEGGDLVADQGQGVLADVLVSSSLYLGLLISKMMPGFTCHRL